jgi:hypothetical protein
MAWFIQRTPAGQVLAAQLVDIVHNIEGEQSATAPARYFKEQVFIPSHGFSGGEASE